MAEDLMGEPFLRYVQIGESGSSTGIDLGTNLGIQKLAGNVRVDSASVDTEGGRRVTLTADVWHEFDLEVDAVSQVLNTNVWNHLHQFVGHVLAGGEFAFEYDSAKVANTTLSVAASRGNSTITVASASGISDGDWLYLENLDEPRKNQVVRVSGAPAGSVITITQFILVALPIGSVCRHWQYFPKCRIVEPIDRNVSFVERPAGQGVSLWDFAMRFRTFRA
jgi:hypothetical protein